LGEQVGKSFQNSDSLQGVQEYNQLAILAAFNYKDQVRMLVVVEVRAYDGEPEKPKTSI
jgi:hypothetical protein